MVQYSVLDATFAALADPTRRGILRLLGEGACSISDLAELFEMTLTGIKKHVRLLEDARMVVTEKRGRVRYCMLGTNSLERDVAWVRDYQLSLEGRLDRLDEFLNRTEGTWVAAYLRGSLLAGTGVRCCVFMGLRIRGFHHASFISIDVRGPSSCYWMGTALGSQRISLRPYDRAFRCGDLGTSDPPD
ncbi:ArsR family transcriptional regulator [Rhodococcus opacus M213]|uniref:ArsR family transcriptional regulator n=1 Tax=Rhodococcus opacus M213 TaxID=1129896 RepID=K8X6U4_RHOOP|nr:ArsR family transcriptional regulator [Rhodococcus opacus M213]